jgi:hypothetical protein
VTRSTMSALDSDMALTVQEKGSFPPHWLYCHLWLEASNNLL